MDALPQFELLRPKSLAEVIEARRAFPSSRLIGGGTDLLVNIRRGIGDAPDALIDMNDVAELSTVRHGGDGLIIGASVRIADLAADEQVSSRFPAVSQAAGEIAGPIHRQMATVGGNICLDTRCVYYNQSEWWREANDFCLKYQGVKCHVAPKSKVCFATFSGDLAAAALIYGAAVDIAGPDGERQLPLADLYTGDGQNYLTLKAGEIVTRLRLAAAPGMVSAYEKMRVRRSIDYPLAGVAVGLTRDGDTLSALRIAVTGTNPRPLRLTGCDDLCGGGLNDKLFDSVDDLMRDQIMAMKTTFTPGHYRRRVAGALARRLVKRLFVEN